MKIVNRKSEIVNGNWLPDMDLNHDKQIQSLLCYRYTIGQAGACDRLKGFIHQSSRQTSSVLTESKDIYARPHPGPLPRGEGEVICVVHILVRCGCRHRLSVIHSIAHTKTCDVRVTNNRRIILPLPGERAGVRAEVTTSLTPSRFTFHASRL